MTSDQLNVMEANPKQNTYQQGIYEIENKQVMPAQVELSGNTIHEAP
jgi:hypothetical protein